jgi:hypothetical protein
MTLGIITAPSATMMPTTINSSTRVKPAWFLRIRFARLLERLSIALFTSFGFIVAFGLSLIPLELALR